MGLFGGIIAGAMQGVGDAGQQIADQSIQMRDKQALLQQQSDLALQKEQALAQFKYDLENAPAKQAGAYLSDAANQQKPVTAAPVTQLSGADPNSSYQNADGAPVAGQEGGLQGDIKTLTAQANALPDSSPDKAPLLAQIARQQASDQSAAQAAVAGQSRSPTMEESFDAAVKRAAENGDARSLEILKKLAGDKYVSIPDGGLLNSRTGEVIQPSSTKLDRQMALLSAGQEGKSKLEDQKAENKQRAADIAFERTHTITPEMEVTAQAIAKGQLPPLTGMSLRSPGAGLTMARVIEINPNYSAKDFGVGSKAEKDFATGKQGNTVRSFNVGISHLNTLSELAGALNNGDMQLFNKIGNTVAVQTGQDAPTNFEAAKKIVGDEIVKAITGSGGALADREDAAKVLSAANSPAQLIGVINTYKNLMAGQLGGLALQYKATTGRDDFSDKYLSDEARQVFHMPSGGSSKTSPTPPTESPSVAAPKVFTYDPKTGTFH